ncbi:hypothetical protein BSKO_02554 [Bryopsis sp. KO-2023]|nr:hypothetical protein BSKO_02554 [Bryopsis sp. KO-2023]
MGLRIFNVRVPYKEQPVCGVFLQPYVLFKDAQTEAVVHVDVLDESSLVIAAAPEQRVHLRSRWLRQVVVRGSASCSIHQDRDAALQCLLCLKARVPTGLSFHCTGECLRNHWKLHETYHERQRQTEGIQDCHRASNGSNHIYPGVVKNDPTGCIDPNGDSKWVQICSSRDYAPSAADIGCNLKYECFLADEHAPFCASDEVEMFVVITSRVLPAPSPPLRAMASLIPLNLRLNREGRFTLLTYNILADLYASQREPCQSPPSAWTLSWQYRRLNLVREVVGYRADVVCLQEVQSNHFDEYFRAAMESHGYLGVFKRKTSEVFVGKALAIDGCATFYRKDRFTLIKKYEVEFNKAACSTAGQYPEPQRHAALQRLSKDNVALIVVLESVQPMLGRQKQLICVANTHIHANPEHSDVKLWQVHTLLKGLEKIAASAEIPIVIAGDFNSEPGSAAHTLLVMQEIDHTHPEVAHDPAHFLQSLLPVHHKLPLHSAYSAMAASDRIDASMEGFQAESVTGFWEPPFTTVTETYKGTLDYIFYTPSLLRPTSLLELPAESEVSLSSTGLPNAKFSSDHICLGAEFQLLCPGDCDLVM